MSLDPEILPPTPYDAGSEEGSLSFGRGRAGDRAARRRVPSGLAAGRSDA